MSIMDLVSEISVMGKQLLNYDITNNDLSLKFFDSQVLDNSCTISAQMQILEKDMGMDLDEFRLAAYASQEGIFDPDRGTNIKQYGGAILKELGYNTTEKYKFTCDSIKNALDSGKEVIVSVDANELYLSNPHEVKGMLGHSVRIIDYDGRGFTLLDPAKGEIHVDTNVLEEARNDFNQYALIVDRPDDNALENIRDLYQQKVMAVDSESIAAFKTQYASHIMHSGDFDNTVLHVNNDLTPQYLGSEGNVGPDLIDISSQLGNLFATGGFYSILEFVKDKPDMQKKVINAAMGLGALDAVIDVGSNGVNFDLELNPLLIASLGVYVFQKVSASKNPNVQSFSKKFNSFAEKGWKKVERVSYAAVGIQVLRFLLDGEVGTALADAFDITDSFDILEVAGHVGDGVDAIEGAATFGLGLLASKAVKFAFEKINDGDKTELEKLRKRTAPKVALAKMLEKDAPLALVTGLRQQMLIEGG